jgi:hypothetical protein
MDQKPTIGRIVHYVTEQGTVRPAMIVQIFDQASYPPGSDTVNLQVFTDFGNDGSDPELASATISGAAWCPSRARSDEPKPRHWHWPPRVS